MDGPPLTPRVPRATLEKLRSVVRDCLEKHLDDSAVFFADKLVSMSGDGDARDPDDLFLYCQALFAGKHHRRALTVMRGEGLVDGGDVPARDVPAVRKNAPRFRLLAARCLAATREWDECLAALGDGDGDESSAADEEESSFSDERTKKISSASAIALLRAQAHEALENRPLARRWYVAALAADPFCYAALEALVANHALSAEEERALIDSLAFDPEDEWLRFLYTSMGKKYDEPAIESGLEMLEEIAGSGSSADEPSGAAPVNETSDEARASSRERLAGLPAELLALRDNGDVALARAEWYYHRGDFKKCHDTCLAILERDPFQLKALPVYLATATELRRKNELYLRAHELVEEYPTRAVSWFAVGCYYYCVRRFDAARRYFSKATSLDGAFVPAWIGFGHAFAAQDESDQAMAAYRTAARLFPGCHLPALCIGMEYRRANNLSLAEQFFAKSRGICPGDPLVHNELGVLAYRNKEYGRAVTHLRDAVALAPRPLTDEWEASVVNVAHAYRKMNDFDAAIEWYERALSLAPRCAGTHTALGFTHQLKGNFQTNMSEAIECYHRALSLRPDDSFAQEMLTLALIDQCAVTMPPYNFVSYEPLAPYADEPGGKADARQDIPVAAEDDEEDDEEDDDMEMSPG
jgi:anaphase-promoting complex subunit 6